MKKLLPVLFIALLFLSCKKESTNGTVTFYTTISQGNWSLILDGTDRGKLTIPPFAIPDCKDNGYITLTLNVGTYKYYANSLDGFASGGEKTLTVTGGSCIIKDVKL